MLCRYKTALKPDTKILIETLIKKIEEQQKTIEEQQKTIAFLTQKINSLEAQIAILRNEKKSQNSHTPPSKDENRPAKNQSLRLKSDKKAGGQSGHEGKTLEFAGVADSIIDHHPHYCNNCGKDISSIGETLIETRQMVDIPIIKPVCTEHHIYGRVCTCGHKTKSCFPSHVRASVQYGPGVASLTGYLHSRQYLPYERMKEFFRYVMDLPISVGGNNHILKRLTAKVLPLYEEIKERIGRCEVIGTDETGVKVNGSKDWMWTWQNDDLTFITHSDNRGFKTIDKNFADGLNNTVLLHDRFACHFNCDALHRQLCTAHLLRDLQYLEELYPKSSWAKEMKALLAQALVLKRQLRPNQYYGPCEERTQLQTKLNALLNQPLENDLKKSKTLQKSLLKHQEYILYFLYHPKVPPDNNGSERAIRNLKVKQKISGQFKSDEGADGYAILRSIIDTSIKSGQNVLNALTLIAKFGYLIVTTFLNAQAF